MKIRFGILCLSLLCLIDCKKNEKEAEKNPKVFVTGPAPPTQFQSLDVQALVDTAYDCGASSHFDL